MNNLTILNDRYQIHKKISTKPGRRIFMAQDLQSGNLVIVKILLFDPDFKWKEHEHFEREAKILKKLEYPAIPKYLDYFDISTDKYHGFALIQTYIDAPSLELLIQNGRKFSEDEIIQLTEKVLTILTYLHQQNPMIIHRDIKPSNILLANRSGNSIEDVYLIDFGCVQTTASKEYGTLSVVGTYGYIPPEQFGGQALPASDLYSLGMTIIYLATGLHPAELPQVNGLYKIETIQLSKRFQKWLEKMIKLNLDQRFISAQVAQQFLTLNELSPGFYSELKPKATDINIHSDSNQMEIILQEQSKSRLDILSLVNKIILKNLISFVFFAFVFLVPFYNLFMSIFVALPSSKTSFFVFLCVCFCLSVAFSIVAHLMQREVISKIVIDDNTIKAFNYWNCLVFSNPRSEVSLLGYSPSYTFDQFTDSEGKQHSRGRVTTESELFIYAGSNKYSIKNLSADEFWWLGHELSAILDLELNVIYPTPKVPPEPSSCGCGC